MKQPIQIDNIDKFVEVINNRKERAVNWNEVSKLSGATKRTLQRRIVEAGYEWSRSELKYLKPSYKALEEVAVSVETNDNNDIPEWRIDDEDTDNDKGEENMNNNESNLNKEIEELVSSFDEKQELVTLSTYVTKDINEALKKWAEGKPRGAKQKLVNGLLERALKDYL